MKNENPKKVTLIAGITPARLAELERSNDVDVRFNAAKIRRVAEARRHPTFANLMSRLVYEAAKALGRKATGLTAEQRNDVIAAAIQAATDDVKDDAAWMRAQSLWADLHSLGWLPDSEIAKLAGAPESVPAGPTAA
jgi:hypothetical protein